MLWIGKRTHPTIRTWERGKQGYSQTMLEGLASALSCSPADLIMRDPSKKEQIWTIWETLKPADREKAIEILIETLL